MTNSSGQSVFLDSLVLQSILSSFFMILENPSQKFSSEIYSKIIGPSPCTGFKGIKS